MLPIMRCSKQMKHSTQNLVSISLMENLQGKYLNLYWIKSKHYFKILFSYKQSSKFVIFFTVIEIYLLTLVKNVQQVMKRMKAVPNLMFCNLTGNDLYLRLNTVNNPLEKNWNSCLWNRVEWQFVLITDGKRKDLTTLPVVAKFIFDYLSFLKLQWL